MKSSARNQFAGTIVAIEHGTEICHVTVKCQERLLYADVSKHSAETLHLSIGQTAVVMVKAQTLTLITDPIPFKLSAENQIECTVIRVEKGAVNHVVILDDNGQNLAAAITLHSSEYLDLHAGQSVLAVFNADQTILAVLS